MDKQNLNSINNYEFEQLTPRKISFNRYTPENRAMWEELCCGPNNS